jgi:hypothetical protein
VAQVEWGVVWSVVAEEAICNGKDLSDSTESKGATPKSENKSAHSKGRQWVLGGYRRR